MPPAPLNDWAPLPAGWFARSAVAVARDLLGQWLVRRAPDTGERWACRIVETEAYTQDDPACHAYRRDPTRPVPPRAADLFQPPGRAYVYLIYGMYDCLNVVAHPSGEAGAVLFRAVEPPVGCDLQTHGPGRLTRALGITRAAHHRQDLCDPSQDLYLAAGPPVSDAAVTVTTRIGIRQAQDYPWRFYIEDSPWVSARLDRGRSRSA